MRPLNLEEAKALAKKFVDELQEEFKIPLIWCFVGSIQKGSYVSGQSDIDLVILPEKKGIFGYEAIKHILNKMEQFKKYGTVWKKGRYISLIDPMFFFDVKLAENFREMINA